MGIEPRDFTVGGQWAKNADTVIPPTPITGRSYRNPNMSQETAEAGTPFDTIWDSSSNNQKDYEVSGIAMQAERFGLPVWSPLTPYGTGALCLGTDEIPYRAKQPSGPSSDDTTQPINPATDTAHAYWQTLAEYLIGGGTIGAYEATPDTLALRNNLGCTQVEDPVVDLDAVNLRTTKRLIAESGQGGGNVSKPEILSPDDDAVMQSFSFKVTASEIELPGGGVPSSSMAFVRTLNSDGTIILGDVVQPYPTPSGGAVELTASVLDTYAGQDVVVLVRYEDYVEGLSPWSDRKPLKMAAALLKKVAVTSPVRNATNVLPNELTITVAGGQWSDGSAFAGVASSITIFDASDSTVAYSSGWVPYTTSFVVPTGTLKTSKIYWVRAQHRASSAPASNPSASLETPLVYGSDSQAGYFTTISATAPSVSALEHTIPKVVVQGTQVTIKMWGAISLDSGSITYALTNMVGGISFSKYSDIQENEEVQMFIPTIAGISQAASVQIRAVSSFGGISSPVIASIVVLGQTEWVYTENDTFTAPADMQIDVWAGGAGGAASQDENGPRNGGGGGCGYNRISITRGQQFIVVVGQRTTGNATIQGASSSFGGLVIGYGGYGGYSAVNPRRGGTGIGAIVYIGGNGATNNLVGGGGGAGDTANGGDGISTGGGGGGVGGGGTTGEDGMGSLNRGGKKGVAGGGGGADSTASGSYGGRGSVVVKAVLGGL